MPLRLDSLELPYFLIFTITPLIVALVLFVYSSRALRHGAVLGFIFRVLLGTLFVTLSAGLAVLGSAMQGYSNLTQETRAATVITRQLGEQQYSAIFTFPDGSEQAFQLLGDQLYVDGYVLKWHPIANVMGFRTVYELDRVEGRYRSLDDTQTQPRTTYSLAPERPVNLFDLTERVAALEFLYDTEYGSATFVEMEDGAMYDVMVSTTGFLVRRLNGQ
ncbi:MAG: hypothetical protein AAF708_19665 [Deinococcota bacterium]